MAFRATAKIDLDPLEKERRTIERRRTDDENRRQRILDVKQRTFGIDVMALGQQIAEKEERLRAEKERDQQLADEATHFARELSRLEAMRGAAKKRMNQSYQQYQLQHQPREAAREWDLNDPNHLKKTQAMRTEPIGAPPTLGASSIQVFQGEDPEVLQRKRYQQEQVRYWRQEKAAEVDAHKQAEADAEAEYVAFSEQIKALSEAHEESKLAIMAGRRKGTFFDNITLAERKQRQAQADRHKQAEIEARDVQTQSVSDLLTENVPACALGAHRVIKYAFKGMSVDQKQAIYDGVAQQLADKEAAKQAEKAQEAAFAAEAETYRKLQLLKEREAQRALHSRRVQVQHDVLQQNAAKRAEMEKLYRESYDLRPTEAYFSKFGTSAR